VVLRPAGRDARRQPGALLDRVRAGSEWLPWFSYLLSGGVTRRNLVPGFAVPLIRAADRLLRPLDRWMALHWHLTVRKQPRGREE